MKKIAQSDLKNRDIERCVHSSGVKEWDPLPKEGGNSSGSGCVPQDFLTLGNVLASRESAYVFARPLFPERTTLLLDLSTHTAVLLQVGEEGVVSLSNLHTFTPSGAKVFLALLQAYPNYCSFKQLITCLDIAYPEESIKDREWREANWERIIRPIRRAIENLASGISDFGMQLVSLRARGYLLVFPVQAQPSQLPGSLVRQIECERGPSVQTDVLIR